MPRLSVRISCPNFEVKGYIRDSKKEMNAIIRKAAIAFLKTAYPLVPVWTGMSRGSFLDLGKFLGVTVRINPKKKVTYYKRVWSAKKKTYIRKSYIKDISKLKYDVRSRFGISTGKKIPKNPKSGKKLSSYQLGLIDKKVKFMFQSKVYHYNLNEFFENQKIQSAPWKSIEKGLKAFNEVLDKESRKKSKRGKFKTVTTISVGFYSNLTTSFKQIAEAGDNRVFKVVRKTRG